MDEKLYLFGKEVLIDGKETTMKECVDRMVEDCRIIMFALNSTPEYWDIAETVKNDLFNVLSKAYWTMWW